ncbi:MAG: discoidin domain-containing protein, partial [Coprobacter sp.]|nr:discoidin domain-containing protein [Coprobacter sp.]
GSSGRFSGNNENGATNQQIKVFKVEDPSAATLTATQVTEITSGGTYMLVASNDGTNYYALTNEITYNTQNDNSTQRMVGAAVTITDGTITYAPGTASVLWNIVLKPSATDKSFFSSFMGSMRYYANTIEGDDQLSERKIVQALMVYVYADRVELKMKNYGQSGTINGVTVNQDLTPYISYRTVTHSDYAVTAAPTITSTGDDVNAETEVTVTVDAPEWHNLYYTINGDTPTESSDKVENGQITFTATEGEYVVKVVAQEGIRLVSPVAEVTYRVVDTHGITVSATEGGTADFSINEEEGTVTLTATEPTEGYYFVGWSVGESAEIVSEDLTYTISIVENAAYKANYAKRTYTVTVSTNNKEWGTVNTIANPVTHGETVTLTATPAEGYRFVNWTVSGNQVSTDATFTTDAITADVEYIANFEEIPQIQYYSVVAIAGTGGSATASSSSVEENTTVTLTATPESGYTFRNWTVAGEEVSTENPYAPTITANTKYVAHFVPENANTLPTGYCTITQRMNEGCSTNAVTNVHSHSLQGLTATYDGNEVLSLPATTATFNDLTSSKQFTVTQGGTIEISFTNGTYSKNVWFGFDWDRDGDFEDVVAAYGEEGRVGGTSDQGSVTINVPDNANIGKSVMRIISDGVDCPASWSEDTPMCGTHGSGIIGYAGSLHDVTLYVEEGYVSDVTYNVTVSSADENMGTASASRNIVPERLTVTLTAEPKDGYRFVNWTNEGNEVSTDNPYTIRSVTDNINYVANFEKLPTYTVTARSNNDAMGVVTPSSSQVIYGNTATIKAVAKPNYRFVNWTKGTDVVSTSATFTTPIITANAEYIANFEAMPTEAEKISIVDASTNFATYQSYVIGNIKDENYSTLFWSEGAQEIDKYVMVDLGALYNVEDIKFYFDSGDKPYGAVVEISTDNSTWTEVSTFVTTDLGADNTYVCDAEKKTAQYIRMRINVAGTNWLKLKEFEVYGLKTTTSSADITKTTATEDATVEVTTDAPATIKVGTETYTTTAENLTATITLNVTSAETVTIESIGANITSIDCGENAVPTELPTTITEVELRNVNAGEVEIEAPLLEKITVVSDAEDNVATVAVTSDLSQGVQVVVEKEIKTSQPVEGKGTPTYFNFLSMPFAFNTADIKY